MPLKLPLLDAAPPPRLPRWLKREVPKGNANHFTAGLLEELRLETVCENAKCPNRMECYSQKTATFMILGNVCTRPCGFCAVSRGRPDDLSKPTSRQRVAEAAFRLGLKHVVITSVTRDDLPDGGAEHFYQCVLAVRERTGAERRSAHARLYRRTRPPSTASSTPRPKCSTTTPKPCRGCTARSAARRATTAGRSACSAASRNSIPAIKTKSGLMLGLGETHEEMFDVLADLLDAGCDFLTLGQYLMPSATAGGPLPAGRPLHPARGIRLPRPRRQIAGLQASRQRAVRPQQLSRPRNGGDVLTTVAWQRAESCMERDMAWLHSPEIEAMLEPGFVGTIDDWKRVKEYLAQSFAAYVGQDLEPIWEPVYEEHFSKKAWICVWCSLNRLAWRAYRT